MGKFDLTRIAGHVSDHPMLEPNRYEVVIVGPVNITRNILFNCHTCDIPGHNIGTFDHSIAGPMRKIPNEEIFDDLSTTFYNSHHIPERKAIDKWIRLIGGENTYKIAYYNDIVSDMQINIYDLQEHLTSVVKIYEAYPVGVSELQLSYAGEAPNEITVNWAYHSFEIKEAKHK